MGQPPYNCRRSRQEICDWRVCITNGISVGIGELISCTILGVLLVKIIESSKALNKIFAEA